MNLDGCSKETTEGVEDGHMAHEYGADCLEPYNGMEFDSQQDAYSFYLQYARCIGFGISTVHSRRSKTSKEFIDVKFACSRYGKRIESSSTNQRPCLKVDCKAMLHLKRKLNGKWYVESFKKEHNHDIYPDKAHYFPCHQNITSANKYNINNLHTVGVWTNKIYATMAKPYCGYKNIGCLEMDIRNHLDKQRRLALAHGDAKAMLEHFTYMQEENPNFFYAMDLDDEKWLKNVFWVDAKSREDYKIFGDVVSFDTTYIINKYKMSFAPFIGMNNHFQTTLFGCALLADEMTSTFTWLMQIWVRAMGGKAPTAILTDQDKGIKAAIKVVFPNTRHHFYLWHIMRKIPKKLGHVVKANGNFIGIFNKCIYNIWTIEEFEKSWSNMIETFELEKNE